MLRTVPRCILPQRDFYDLATTTASLNAAAGLTEAALTGKDSPPVLFAATQRPWAENKLSVPVVDHR